MGEGCLRFEAEYDEGLDKGDEKESPSPLGIHDEAAPLARDMLVGWVAFSLVEAAW